MGVLACCFSEITKNTGDEERGKILARVMMGRQIGLIVGPTANFIFLNLDTKIKIGNWNWELNNLTAPGLLMTGLWFFLEIFILLFYKNLNEFSNTQPPVSARVQRNEDSEATSLLNNNEIDNKYQSFAQNSSFRSTTDEQANGGNINEDRRERIIIIDNSQTGNFFKRLYNEYIREEVVAVLSINFTVFFMQTTLEVRSIVYKIKFHQLINPI